jgi:cytochrome c oxidase subunit 3
MAGTSTTEDIELIIEDIGGGGGGKPPAGGGGEGDGGDDRGNDRGKPRRSSPPSPRRYYTGITIGIVSILMFFMALASAFLLRRGISGDWVPVHLPRVLWVNTVVLLASSFTLELARRRLSHAKLRAFRTMWAVTTALGMLFLAGQLFAWRQLVGSGIFLASNPGSSFFYILTGAHAVHLFGGIAALMFVSFRKFENAQVSLSTAAEITSHYWHFMDALWVFLFALLYLGK